MPIPLGLEITSQETLRIALDPARNAVASLVLLTHDDEKPGMHEWVSRTKTAFSTEEMQQHRLVILGMFYAVAPQADWHSFPAYLEHLSSISPEALQDKLLNAYARIRREYGWGKGKEKGEVDWGEILSSAEHYIEFLKGTFGKLMVDPELEARAYAYVLDPPAMKTLILEHLNWVWDEHLKTEWARVEPMLREAVKAFQTVDLGGMDRMQAARFITGQELDDEKWKIVQEAKQVVFVPNAHIGPYLTRIVMEDTLAVFFGARKPEHVSERIPDLDRAELVVRLGALADDTRLRILQMVAENGEVRSQEIIEVIGLSQPTASRHLTQLTATSYLQERREGGAKVYVLNPERIEATLKALAAFLQLQ